MKILVSCDWHLKLNTKNIPNEWAINRYKSFFKQIHELESQVSLHILAGDCFDKLPNMEELALYFEFVSGCTIETIIFSGNHCAIKKNTTFLSHLKGVTNSINPLVRIVDECFSNDTYDIIPYQFIKEFKPETFHNKILFTHVRATIEPFVKPEIDLDKLNRWDVVLAGDLHSYSNSQRNILYPGSPMTTSFHRTKVDTGVIIFDTDTMSHIWHKLDLPQLLKKTIKIGQPMLEDTYDRVIYELEGDMAELSAIQDSDLISKKVVKRETDTALMLDPKMSLPEELKEYLLYVLQLDDAKADSLVHILNNNIHKIE